MNTDILEGNKIIAYFMNIPINKNGSFDVRNVSWNINEGTGYAGEFYYLEFDSSWDWLMPVIEKIASEDNSSVNIHYGTGCTDLFAWCTIEYRVNGKFYNTPRELNSDQQDLIKATWLAVVDFIKWYNKNY